MIADYIRCPTQPGPSEKGLFGGAIQLAGEVKARGARRRVRSDWMAVERERGISVSSAVMSFEHQGRAFNLLDTPGHKDFSPMGFQRGHLPHPDRGRQRGDHDPGGVLDWSVEWRKNRQRNHAEATK